MPRKLFVLALALVLLIPATARAQGEAPELQLRLTRDFGYGGFDNSIQGTFSMRVEGPEDLVQVAFYIDSELVAISNEAPHHYQFKTADFDPGEHFFYVLGETSPGEQLGSNDLTRIFISGEEARDSTLSFVVPLLAIVGVLGLLSAVVPRVIFKNQSTTLREYGVAGGAVCRRCGKPFTRHVWAPNLVTGKLERCPHCGKWAIVPRASAQQLEAGEALLREDLDGDPSSPTAESEEDRLRHQIDESRFD